MRSTTTRGARRRRAIAGVGFVVSLYALALAGQGCGARGPLDDTPYDAGSDVSVALVDAAPDVAEEAGADADATAPGLLECGQCLLGECSGATLACVQSEGCRATVQCIATTCVSSGSPDLPCVLRCAASNDGVAPALGLFQCVTDTCGADCTSVLGSLLGAVGGGGGGGTRDAGSADAGRRDAGDLDAGAPGP